MTEQDKFVLHNPLEDPIEGVDTVNEEEKGFFDNALESIRSFFSSIGDLMEDAGESLIKSVYMNSTSFRPSKTIPLLKMSWRTISAGWSWIKPSLITKVKCIIFGQSSEESNIAAARRSITVIRLIFNLLCLF